MKLGAVFPQTEMPADAALVKDYAQALEGMGYDYVLAYDHVVGADVTNRPGWNMPYTSVSKFHEPLTLFAYLAGVTTKLAFASGVIIMPQRQTVLFAKQAANLDVFCNGRLRLGLGIGWNVVEYEALGAPFDQKGARLDEQIVYLRRLWTEDSFSFAGKFHKLTEAGLNPLPRQRPIPLWIGGASDVAMDRAAKLGDGWMPVFAAEQANEKIGQFRERIKTYGRDPSKIGMENLIFTGRTLGGRLRSWEDAASDVHAWRKAGATHTCIQTMDAGHKTIDDHIEFLRKVKEAS